MAAPFNFKSVLRKPETRIEFLPVLDLIVIALLFSLIFTRFVSVPGLAIDLPNTTMEVSPSGGAVAVLTVNLEESLYFDGAVYDLRSVKGGFSGYLARQGGEAETILLVRMEGALSMQTFMRICELAQEAGFKQVQVLGDRDEVSTELFAPSGERGGVRRGILPLE